MNRVTGVDSSDDHFVTEEEPSRSTTCFTVVPKSLNSLQVLDSTTHRSDNRAPAGRFVSELDPNPSQVVCSKEVCFEVVSEVAATATRGSQ